MDILQKATDARQAGQVLSNLATNKIVCVPGVIHQPMQDCRRWRGSRQRKTSSDRVIPHCSGKMSLEKDCGSVTGWTRGPNCKRRQPGKSKEGKPSTVSSQHSRSQSLIKKSETTVSIKWAKQTNACNCVHCAPALQAEFAAVVEENCGRMTLRRSSYLVTLANMWFLLRNLPIQQRFCHLRRDIRTALYHNHGLCYYLLQTNITANRLFADAWARC